MGTLVHVHPINMHCIALPRNSLRNPPSRLSQGGDHPQRKLELEVFSEFLTPVVMATLHSHTFPYKYNIISPRLIWELIVSVTKVTLLKNLTKCLSLNSAVN